MIRSNCSGETKRGVSTLMPELASGRDEDVHGLGEGQCLWSGGDPQFLADAFVFHDAGDGVGDDVLGDEVEGPGRAEGEDRGDA